MTERMMAGMAMETANKTRIREAMAKHRDALMEKDVIGKSSAIDERLMATVEYRKARAVLFYAAKGNEARTKDMIEAALKEGKKVLLPLTDLKNKEMEIAAIDDYSKDLRKGAFGIMEPNQKKAFDKAQIDTVIVPGLAFDGHGHRLGYGHGFYDKLLHRLNKAVKIGLAYDFQVVNTLRAEAHDQRMDLIVTESRIIRCR
ncbi:MAG: 5-formyltetrahydrofolate cyclo-ligase [Nanoarchaeota archaeon]